MRHPHWAILFFILPLMGFFSPGYGQGTPSGVDSLNRKWVIGGNQSEENVLFGDITAIAHHPKRGLHILDTGLQQVVRYDGSSGSRSGAWKLTEGEGPGEFYYPLDLATDKNGNVYIAGRQLQRIAQFSSTGMFQQQFRAPGAPTRVAAIDGQLFVTTFWLSSRTVLHTLNQTGTKQQGLLDRPKSWEITAMTGNFERIAATSQGTVLYTVPYPYRILEVNTDGSVVRRGSGHPEFETPPKKSDGAVTLRVGARGIDVLDETDQVVHLIIDNTTDQVYLDLFSRDLRFQQRLNITDELPSVPLPILETGPKSTLYFVYENPYPTIAAYTLAR